MPVLTYKCTNCGGDLKFDPKSQKFVCKFCASNFVKSELEPDDLSSTQDNLENKDLHSDTADKNQGTNNATLFICPSCGAEVITDDTTAATQCYYCHNPVVLSGRLDGKYLPSRLIPFKFNKDAAIEKFVAWTKKKFFLPKDFFSKRQIENLSGVYFPYWIIDCDTKSGLSADGKIIRTWTTGNTKYTETKIYRLEREGDVHLEDIIKTGLKKANKRLVENVQPFNEQELIPFSMTYLSGFQAEKRDIEQEELEQEVIADINKFSEQLLFETTKGYTNVTKNNSFVHIQNIDWEYGLLPVWIMTYKYKGQQYYYAMNGQTGKTIGKLPVDMKKLCAVAGAISATILAIGTIGGLLI